MSPNVKFLEELKRVVRDQPEDFFDREMFNGSEGVEFSTPFNRVLRSMEWASRDRWFLANTPIEACKIYERFEFYGGSTTVCTGVHGSDLLYMFGVETTAIAALDAGCKPGFTTVTKADVVADIDALISGDKIADSDDRKKVAGIAAALRDYYGALDARKNGDTAMSRAFDAIQEAMGMSWNRWKAANREAR